MRIIGIDPGIATIGFGIVNYQNNRCILEKCGVITTPAHTSLSSRLSRIYADLLELLKMFKPDAVSTGIPVAHGRGVILLACEHEGIPIFEYTPLQVKQAVTGYGRAEKKQVMEMVRRICSLAAVPKPDDAADAVALAICHARSSTSLLMNEGASNSCSTI